MKKITLLAVLAIAAFSNNATAQNTASATATATIVTPIAIATTGPMIFGNVVATGTAGTVTLSIGGDRGKTGGVTLPGTAIDFNAASFEVTGTGDYGYAITLPINGEVTLKATVGTGEMAVTDFTDSLAGIGNLKEGKQKFTVGGTLEVNADQVAGAYTGSFNVIVNYN
jgi:hypothetical protein